MTVHTINLGPEASSRREAYGVLLTSETRHTVTSGAGKRVHNPHHPHRLDVWENRVEVPGSGVFTDPSNRPTSERYSYLLSPLAVVISASHQSRAPEGPTIAIGDRVELKVHGYSLGLFRVDARPLHDPHLTPIKGDD